MFWWFYFFVNKRIIKELHDRKVAHRDIKPSNFVYSHRKRVWKLVDFGVSKIADDINISKEYNICGTRLYAIP